LNGLCNIAKNAEGKYVYSCTFFRRVKTDYYLSHVYSVRPSAWKNSATTGRIFMKFNIAILFKNLLRKFKFH